VLAGGAVITLKKAPGMQYGKMGLPVIFYALALSAMAAKAMSGLYLAGAGVAWPAAVGGLLFFASDVVLAFIEFNSQTAKCLRAVNLVLYYVGQGLLAVSVAMVVIVSVS
jgi:uncharacterized membrane protein YhhN